ncbi:hypothetical protein AB1287_17230 [Enterobacter asburiae]|uniref:hypothetical protein n=1 Tax=Scandinavium sp. UTDF21-P1B TaxID=3446379 RepID=UPI003489DABA
MKIPRYLVIALAATGLVVMASQFWGQSEEPSSVVRPVKSVRNPATAAAVTRQADERQEIVDLFPVPEVLQPVAAPEPQSPAVAEKIDPPFAFQVVGAWWKDGQRIVIISDGAHSRLLCQQCQAAGVVRPGEALALEWRLDSIADDHLMVEWLPQNLLKRIELGDLKSKPAR